MCNCVRRGHCLSFSVDVRFLPTYRDTELGHWDVVRVDTETHTLLDVWREATGLWWALAFLLSGAPGKKEKKKHRRGERYSGIRERHTHTHTRMYADVVTRTGSYSFKSVGTWGKRECPAAPWWMELRHIYHIASLPVNGDSLSTGWEQWHLKQWLLYTWKWSRSVGGRGGPRLWKAVLMTGIHGQCQGQVEMWMSVGRRWGGGRFLPLLIPQQVQYNSGLVSREAWTLCGV